jgi:hypothetical protein
MTKPTQDRWVATVVTFVGAAAGALGMFALAVSGEDMVLVAPWAVPLIGVGVCILAIGWWLRRRL